MDREEIEELLGKRSWEDQALFWNVVYNRLRPDDGVISIDLTIFLPAVWVKKAKEIRKNNKNNLSCVRDKKVLIMDGNIVRA